MKKFKLLSLIGITSLALAHAGWAAGHGGGGGGFYGGGGHFGGGGAHFGGGGVPRGGGAGSRGGRVGFGGPRFSLPAEHFSTIRPGHSFSSLGMRHSGIRPHVFRTPNRGVTTQSPRVAKPFNRGLGRGPTNRPGRSNIVARKGGAIPQGVRPSRTLPQRGLNGRTDHIAERHEANWHGNWDRRRAHYHRGRFFVFRDGFWFGLDEGFFPWDYLPYYAYDYYPYDYYPAGARLYDNDAPVYSAPLADSTVQAAQTLLAQLGYYGDTVDGLFGPSTRDAVAKYQIANHLNVTGSLSPDTLKSLGLPQGIQG